MSESFSQDPEPQEESLPVQTDIQDAPPLEEEETPFPDETPSLGWGGALLRCLPVALLFGAVAFLVGFRNIAELTLPHILTSNDVIQFQEVVEGLPVPVQVDWNLSLVHAMVLLDRLDFRLALLLGGGLGALALLFAISVVNPTFRLLRFYASEKGGVAHQAIGLHSVAIGKAFRLTIWAGLPIAVVGLLAARFGAVAPWGASGLFWGVMGVCFWSAFSSQGAARTFDSPKIFSLKAHGALLAGRGIAFGGAATLLFGTVVPLPSQRLLLYYHTLGAFQKGSWAEVSLPYLLSMTLSGVAFGLILLAMGSSRLQGSQKLGFLFVAFCIALASLGQSKGKSDAAFAKKWDLTRSVIEDIQIPYHPRKVGSGVSYGYRAGAELARLAKLPAPKQEGRPLLIFDKRGVVNARQMLYSEDGLTTDPATEKPILDFLKQRNYRTALSWTAMRHLYNIGAANFDNTAAIRACMIDLERTPHVFQCIGTVQQMLFIVAATPQNLAFVDQLADEKRFAHPDRRSVRMMGDLYLRYGEVQKALQWYRRAEMPKSFIRRIENVKPMFREGRVSGRLTWNGKPLAGVHVGVYPTRLNGLPRTLEMTVLRAGESMMAPFGFSPRFPRFHPRPFAMRWVSAGTTTDAEGRFSLQKLTEGEYQLVCTLPETAQLEPPSDPRLVIQNAPKAWYLGYSAPVKDFGVIAVAAPESKSPISWKPSAPAPERRAAPSP